MFRKKILIASVLVVVAGIFIYQNELKSLVTKDEISDYTASVNNVSSIQTKVITSDTNIKLTSENGKVPITNTTTETANITGLPTSVLITVKNASDASKAAVLFKSINIKLSQNFEVLAQNYTVSNNKLVSFFTSSKKTWPKGVEVLVGVTNNIVDSSLIKTPHCVKSFEINNLKDKAVLSSIISALKKSGGDCLVLAPTKSIIPFMGVPMSVWSTDGGKTISKEFLEKMAISGGLSLNDMGNEPLEVIKKIHENYSHPSLKFVCGEAFNNDEMTNGEFCNFLQSSLQTEDCSMIFEGPAQTGHVVRVTKVTKTKNGCELENEDTGQQGDGEGKNTPSNPGNQKWSFGATGIKLISTPKKEEKKMYESLKFDTAFAICCAVEAK